MKIDYSTKVAGVYTSLGIIAGLVIYHFLPSGVWLWIIQIPSLLILILFYLLVPINDKD